MQNHYAQEVMTLDWREKIMVKTFHIVKRFNLDKILQDKVSLSTRQFNDYFKGFDRSDIVKRIFGEKTEEVLRNLKVEFTWVGGYMWVNNLNGNLIVNLRYLKKGDRLDIYLDLIHELVHVRQFMEGKDLFDNNYSYVERPTEIEAYSYAVDEAKKLGVNDDRICKYLKTEWMSKEDLKQLAIKLNIKCS